MSFNIIYVEDDTKMWEDVESALRAQCIPDKDGNIPLVIIRAETPEDLRNKLSLKFDLIIADVYYRDPITHQQNPRLTDIITFVDNWSSAQNSGRPLPIIAYTGQGPGALKLCLSNKDRLYDIWDKNTATPEYVVWRLSMKAQELTRIRPDAIMQRLIREMDEASGAPWHKFVVDMTRQYDAGLTEKDQIDRASADINAIALQLGVQDVCGPMWDVMVKWEPLSRAISEGIRGHARHVINVFWLGYYLLHHKDLRDIFAKSWRIVFEKRSDMGPVANVEPLEALSNSWFYAGLFHDVGGCIEKSSKVCTYLHGLLNEFGDIAPSEITLVGGLGDDFVKKADDWLHEFNPSLRELIIPILEANSKKEEPDQGVVGAIYFRNRINEGMQSCFAREGGRAMSLHNLFPKLGPKMRTLPIAWEDEPLVCLLLLCDQLQTWDRERGDDSLMGSDSPSRAQLSFLNIEKSDSGKPQIKMGIDYIAPDHLFRSQELYEREKMSLDRVLAKYPHSALSRIKRPWPFKLNVRCTFSGAPLTTEMNFGD